MACGDIPSWMENTATGTHVSDRLPVRGFGKFDNSPLGILFGAGRYHIRRVAGRPYFANSAPVVVERPDGRLKPGELKSGSYGFYDKGNQKKDALSNLEVDVKPRP